MCCAASRGTEPLNAISPMLRRISRRLRSFSWSDIALPHLVGKILRGTPCQRYDCQRHVLIRVADERRSVRDEKVLYVVCLAILVERGSFRVVSHPDRTSLVDDRSAHRDPGGFALRIGQPENA